MKKLLEVFYSKEKDFVYKNHQIHLKKLQDYLGNKKIHQNNKMFKLKILHQAQQNHLPLSFYATF